MIKIDIAQMNSQLRVNRVITHLWLKKTHKVKKKYCPAIKGDDYIYVTRIGLHPKTLSSEMHVWEILEKGLSFQERI